ncbi:hypothetical protein JOL62DRAFT_554787 [Phyllosticta paracitricarpa]|uniref:Uncharacterized protein n=1 Tax=Phyllosticta paracitricarpa TaxID=2016321 RepID=A0ABR1NCE7_9PEZI
MVNWTAQNDQKLLLAILKVLDKPIPYAAIASELVAMGFENGLTGKAVSRHIDKLKTDMASGKMPSDNSSHAKNVSNIVAEAGKLTKSAKKNAGMPYTPEKKNNNNGKEDTPTGSASSTPANTEKKRKRILDDIGFRDVAQDTPMHDESPAKRMVAIQPKPMRTVIDDGTLSNVSSAPIANNSTEFMNNFPLGASNDVFYGGAGGNTTTPMMGAGAGVMYAGTAYEQPVPTPLGYTQRPIKAENGADDVVLDDVDYNFDYEGLMDRYFGQQQQQQ